jgi:ferredoxin
MNKIRVNINKDKCIGCGSCSAMEPDIFGMNEDNVAQISSQYRDKIIDDKSIISKILEVRDLCPNGAIEIEEIE